MKNKIDIDGIILWLPVVFATGIFFSLNYTVFIYVLFTIPLLIYLFIKLKNFLLILLIFFLLGYLRGYIFIKNNSFDKISNPTGYVKIYGKILEQNDKINYENKKIKEIIVLTDKINNEKRKILLKIRLLNPNEKVYNSKVILSSILFPIKNFDSNLDRYYYFKKIGGLGYKGKIIYNEKKETLNIRTIIADKIINSRTETPSSGIMVILITGKKDKADKKSIEYMNYSGLSHLLSISGLHMMTLIGIVFFLSKWILLKFECIALNYNIFKISASISLIVNLFYLLLSGSSVSAVRAYFMSLILLVSIFIERFNTSMRSVMFTMFFILLIKPSLIFSAGFQMSFIAVISLISCFELFYKKDNFINFILMSFITSFATECATTPFSIYHFNNYSFYNVIANSFLTPLVSFIILPLSILSLFFMPFGLEKLLLIPSSYIMDFVLYISKKITELPYSVFFVQSPNSFSMFFMILGVLWFSLINESRRYIGIIFYIIGLIIFFNQKIPDVIKTENSIIFTNKNIAYIYTNNNNGIFNITKKFGIEKYYIFKYDFVDCNKKYCIKIINKENEIIFIKNGKYKKLNKKDKEIKYLNL